MLLGVLTGVGGGVVRDVPLNRVPLVLRADVYAVAALAGALVVVIGVRRGARPEPMMALGAIVCFALRLGAIFGTWNLPTA